MKTLTQNLLFLGAFQACLVAQFLLSDSEAACLVYQLSLLIVYLFCPVVVTPELFFSLGSCLFELA